MPCRWHWGHGSEEDRQNICPHGTYILVGRQKINKKNIKYASKKNTKEKNEAGRRVMQT